jgi:hypothetical protein
MQFLSPEYKYYVQHFVPEYLNVYVSLRPETKCHTDIKHGVKHKFCRRHPTRICDL